MEKLLKIIKNIRPDAEFGQDTRLIDGGLFDSLDIVTLVTDINDAYGIHLTARDVLPESFNTPRDIAHLISLKGGMLE